MTNTGHWNKRKNILIQSACFRQTRTYLLSRQSSVDSEYIMGCVSQ